MLASSSALTPASEQAEADVVVDCLVADLEATELNAQPKQQQPSAAEQQTPAQTACSVAAVVAAEQSIHLHTLPSQSQQHEASAELTPEQETAAEKCAEQFVDLYEHAWLSRAVQQLAETCQQQGLPEAAVAKKLRTRGIDLAQLQARAAEVLRGVAECASDEGWKLIQDGQLRLLYRHSPGSTVHCFKATCGLPAPMEQPLAMAREFDLVTSWNSYITNSPILKTFCDIDMLVYASVWLPWPFAERDVLISAVADDQLKEHGVIAVSFASPQETPSDVDLPDGADQRVRLYFTEGSCMTITPVAVPQTVTVHGSTVTAEPVTQNTQITIVSNIDTKLAHVPEAIISFVLKVFAPFMYKTVLHVLHTSFDDPTAPLPQRLAQHQELYAEMRQRCQDFLDGHPQ